jgi:hypothetical protein
MRKTLMTCSVAIVAFAGCGDGGGWIELEQLQGADVNCVGERAAVPASRSVFRVIGPPAYQSASARTADYVSYQSEGPEIFVYFSFPSSLPESPDTDAVRASLDHSYIAFDLKQPRDIGGSVTLSSAGVLLQVEDFERLEVIDGQLQWRFRGETAGGYVKVLTIYDEDPANDPRSPDTCSSGDIVGICACYFGGPTVTFTLDGTISM